MRHFNKYFLSLLVFFNTYTALTINVYALNNDHEKAIQAVKDEEILPLDQILAKIQEKFSGRVIAINLKDNEKGLFGWVYDIRMIDKKNKIINLRVDAGTSTVLDIESAD